MNTEITNNHVEKLKKINPLSGFKSFLREQGIVSLAIGFILGTAITKLVSSLVTDIINPVLSVALGGIKNLSGKVLQIGEATVTYGVFINNIIDFIIIALVVYLGIKFLDIDKTKIKK